VDELKNIAPNLNMIGKKLPFGVPDGYFENLPANLNKRIQEDSKTPHPVIRLSYLKPYLAAATILFAVFIAGTYLINKQTDRKSTERFSMELSRVVEEELYSISEEMILEAMESDHDYVTNDNDDNTDEMIDYLMNEDLNAEELLDAL